MSDGATRAKRRRAAAWALALALAVLAGWSMRWQGDVRADTRPGSQPAHFKSGSARSEAILQEIAGSLKRIESRLERWEQAAQVPGKNRAGLRQPGTE